MHTDGIGLMRRMPAPRVPWLLTAAIMLSVLGARAGAATGPAMAPADLIAALEAPGSHASLGANAGALARLVGDWDVEYTDHLKDGKITHRSGQFILAWVLDGRALQDFWVVDPSATGKEREVYTEVFYFEPKTSTWSEVSIDPQEGSIATFKGGANADDGVILESKDLVPTQLRRWSFSDIRPNAFVFRDEASKDDGKTWTLKAEYRMTRRTGVRRSSD
jgi:hypothetical protein